jgi:hypothetical protein
LSKRLDTEDVERYLRDCAWRGFTHIQGYLLRGLDTRNPGEHLPSSTATGAGWTGFCGDFDATVEHADDLRLVMSLASTMGEDGKRREELDRQVRQRGHSCAYHRDRAHARAAVKTMALAGAIEDIATGGGDAGTPIGTAPHSSRS